MRWRRIICLLAGSIALFGFGAFPAVGAVPQDTLELDPTQPSPTVDFGDGRKLTYLTVRFLAENELKNAPQVSLTPFQTSDGEILKGEVTGTAELIQENRTVRVKLTFDALDDAAAGTYTSGMLLRGQGLADARATITAKLDPKPVCGAALIAIALLLAGAGLGLLGRYIINVGLKLREQQERHVVVETHLGNAAPLPEIYHGKLAALRIQLARGNADSSEATLKEMENKAAAAVQAANDVGTMRGIVAAQEARLEDPSLAALRSRFALVFDAERALIDAAIKSPSFEEEEAVKQRGLQSAEMRLVSSFIENYVDADDATRYKLAPALEYFKKGEFKVGDEKAKELLEQEGALGAAVEDQPDPTPAPTPNSVTTKTWRDFLVHHSPTVAAGFTALALVILGLFTLYDPDSTFRTDGFLEGVGLFAWGLGSAAAGTGLAELTGKLTAGRGGDAK